MKKCILKKTLALGFGISKLTQEQVNKLIKESMKNQGINENEAKKLAKDLIKKSKETQQKVNSLLMDAANNFFHSAGLATMKDINKIKKDVTKKRKSRKSKMVKK